MTAPHDPAQLPSLVEYTVAITVTVQGGARWQTAYRRAQKLAERLANTASRTAHVVEVTALAGPSRDGQLSSPSRVGFSAANTGSATYAEPTKLDRYLDPEHACALASLAAANAGARARTQADQQRRLALGCLNLFRLGSQSPARCDCVYCTPAEHEHVARLAEAGRRDPLSPDRCICGQTVPSPASRCPRHVDHDLVVLDGDSDALRRLARLTRRLEPPIAGEQTRRSDGPDLSPGGP